MDDIIIDAPFWQSQPIIKRLDGTFEITSEIGPYQVCPKDIDPDGTYDFDEVSAFWANLSDNDPRKLTQPALQPIIVTMAEAQAAKLKEIIDGANAAEAYAKQGYTTIETASWPEQEVGARTLLEDVNNTKNTTAKMLLLADNVVKTCVELVTNLAQSRGVDVRLFAAKICMHADEADRLMKQLWIGEQAGFERQLAEVVASGDIAAVQALEIAYSLPPRVMENE